MDKEGEAGSVRGDAVRGLSRGEGDGQVKEEARHSIEGCYFIYFFGSYSRAIGPLPSIQTRLILFTTHYFTQIHISKHTSPSPYSLPPCSFFTLA